MNKKYKVEWAAVAESDLKQIIDYMAADSPGNALQIFKKIRQKASSLYSFPERGRISSRITRLKEYIFTEN